MEPDENGTEQPVVQHYTLREGESLIDTAPPTFRPYAGAVGFISPKWLNEAWSEAATENEITTWEADHPAPAGGETPPTTADLAAENKLLRARIEALTDQNDFHEELIVELANIVYA